jgi:hypothetical protein
LTQNPNPRARRVVGTIRIDFSPSYQAERDLEICLLAFGKVSGSRNFWLPQGEMACDAFDDEVAEAWNRLTPGQQNAVIKGQFTLRTPRAFDAALLELEAAHRGISVDRLMLYRHNDEEDFDRKFMVP